MLKATNLVKVYHTEKIAVTALKGVTFHISAGSFVAIMGPSGSGKSTLMNILGCLDTPTEGQYILDGLDVSHMEENDLAGVRNLKIGFVFQTFNLLPRISCLRNVELPMIYAGIGEKERKDKAFEALTKVGLAKWAAHRPTEISGGQRQRVAIARALVNNPAIIMADEPTGNLDTRSGEEVMAIFQELNQQGVTIVLVTHEPEIAQHTQRILKFRDGLLMEDESVEEPVQARDILAGLPAMEEGPV
ncbi:MULTISPECIES: ABC transporter ATP-binding protein [Desulfitobacterium]|uniref:ABC-type antimicrobial peptide transport system, ATPase component n=2 Tax=Desulfitobacterium dehalogenans TaxID=36854 RepID=I4A7C5_DESDJ|nr:MULTISPECIES: ABC transporter ATP-binding protein [Desulfitobacterium]AFL99859.1 ABC-type antimicrobial peptide transport system, ATPase component [Desulfitobacterium dehalogenans ATCC 51507]HHY26566.1 ABC transporter ATP-binding protein [Desulfitobacterium dehalogenans]